LTSSWQTHQQVAAATTRASLTWCLPAAHALPAQIQLFTVLAKELGWSDEDWQWGGCLDWDEMLDDLADPEGLCYMAAAGGRSAHPSWAAVPTGRCWIGTTVKAQHRGRSDRKSYETCMLQFFAAIDVTQEYLQMDIKFSWPM
jgi:hypothetical protein